MARVELVPHRPEWVGEAAQEARRLADTLGDLMAEIHHVGSTSIPGILAKPVLDFLPVVRSLRELDEDRSKLGELGYEWRGEFGIPGRRFCLLEDRATGCRLAHLHIFEEGSPQISRHLAFRDYVSAHPAIARTYETEKLRCAALHPDDNIAYSGAKDAWIRAVERDAIAWAARLLSSDTAPA